MAEHPKSDRMTRSLYGVGRGGGVEAGAQSERGFGDENAELSVCLRELPAQVRQSLTPSPAQRPIVLRGSIPPRLFERRRQI